MCVCVRARALVPGFAHAWAWWGERERERERESTRERAREPPFSHLDTAVPEAGYTPPINSHSASANLSWFPRLSSKITWITQQHRASLKLVCFSVEHPMVKVVVKKKEYSRLFSPLKVCSSLRLDSRLLPQPCFARSSFRPRGTPAWSPSSYLLEWEVLEQHCMSRAWHCSIQMSVGTERITQNPGTNWVPMISTSSTQWM